MSDVRFGSIVLKKSDGNLCSECSMASTSPIDSRACHGGRFGQSSYRSFVSDRPRQERTFPLIVMVHAYSLVAEQFRFDMKKTVRYLVIFLTLLFALWLVAPRRVELLLFIPYVFFLAAIDR